MTPHRHVLRELAEGRIPQELPRDCEHSDELHALVAYLREIQRMALALASGDLSLAPSTARGPVVGGLKSLHASLRHLTWQAQQIAAGDFSQRVDFMGDFSHSFNRMVEQLARARDELMRESTHDALTGLYNRGYFDAELARFSKGRLAPISVVVVDLDGLKRVNDSRGHAAGDSLIAKAARVLQSAFRAEDIVARTGGDEFAVLLPAVGHSTALSIVERLAERTRMANDEADGYPLSMSVGQSTAECAADLAVALRLADERMYADKRARKAERAD